MLEESLQIERNNMTNPNIKENIEKMQIILQEVINEKEKVLEATI